MGRGHVSDTPDEPRRSPAELLADIRAALRDREVIKDTRSGRLDDDAERRLRTAVEAARDAGIEWGRIADALGTRRGNAYQRYRRKPTR